MCPVRDWMTSPAVTVGTQTPIADVLHVFDRGQISALPVLDEAGRVAGVISTTDIVQRMTRPLDEAFVAGDVMSAPAIIARPGEELELVVWRMVAARAHHLVVVERELPVGVLSVGDALGGLLARQVHAPIRSIMSRSLESILLGDSISEAIERLGKSGVHALIVLDGLAPVGIFGQAEALAACRFPSVLLADPVEEMMCHDIITLDVETPIHRAARYSWSTKARRILVKKKEQLVGVVSDMDLVEAMARAPSAAEAS